MRNKRMEKVAVDAMRGGEEFGFGIWKGRFGELAWLKSLGDGEIFLVNFFFKIFEIIILVITYSENIVFFME